MLINRIAVDRSSVEALCLFQGEGLSTLTIDFPKDREMAAAPTGRPDGSSPIPGDNTKGKTNDTGISHRTTWRGWPLVRRRERPGERLGAALYEPLPQDVSSESIS